MNFLDLVGTLIELAKADEELSDEVRTIRVTLESLKIILNKIDLEQISQTLKSELESILTESTELIKKISSQKKKWFSNIKNMLPGGDLSQIKDKNQKLLTLIPLLNLALTANGVKRPDPQNEWNHGTKTMRTATRQESMGNGRSIDRKPTISSEANDVFTEATLPDMQEDNRGLTSDTLPDDGEMEGPSGDLSFKMLMLYDSFSRNAIKGVKGWQNIVYVNWDNNDRLEYQFNRANFPYLPSEIMQRISRDHAAITAIRKNKKPNSKKNAEIAATVDDSNNAMFGATVDDSAKLLEATIDDSEVGQEELKNSDDENEYILKDISLNGTYYIKNQDPLDTKDGCVKLNREFIQLKKDQEVRLEHGDIVALVTKKPQHNELIFGFQFLLE